MPTAGRVKIGTGSAVLLLGLFSALASPAASAELKVSASFSTMTTLLSKVAEPFTKKTGIQIVCTQKNPKGAGSDEIFEQVDKGIASVGFSSIAWEDWVELMEQKKYKTDKLGDFHTRVVGNDSIEFITFPGGPKVLTIPQIKDLLLGKIKNWREVGGPDVKVLLVHTPNQPGLAKFLENHFLGKQPVSMGGAKILDQASGAAEVVLNVAKTPGAFGFVGLAETNSSVNVTEHPPVGRPITAAFLGKATPETEALFDFIKSDAAKHGVKLPR